MLHQHVCVMYVLFVTILTIAMCSINSHHRSFRHHNLLSLSSASPSPFVLRSFFVGFINSLLACSCIDHSSSPLPYTLHYPASISYKYTYYHFISTHPSNCMHPIIINHGCRASVRLCLLLFLTLPSSLHEVIIIIHSTRASPFGSFFRSCRPLIIMLVIISISISF